VRRPASRRPQRRPHEYAFDVRLLAVIRVEAADEAEARAVLYDHIDGAAADFGPGPDGEPLVGEAVIDGEPELVEINGMVV
jgi:hypothetical protein